MRVTPLDQMDTMTKPLTVLTVAARLATRASWFGQAASGERRDAGAAEWWGQAWRPSAGAGG